MSDVIAFPGINGEKLDQPNTRYAEGKVPIAVEFLENCGLASEFLAIFARHTKDLELVIEDPGEVGGSRLAVSSRIENDQKVWHRSAILSRMDLSHKKTMLLETVVEKLELDVDEQALHMPALNWGFYELLADVLGNSVSMQARYNKYIPDWNGQASCYLGQFAVSEAIFDAYGSTGTHDLSDEEHRALQHDIAKDYLGMRAGIALELLRDNLLLHVTGKVTQANWIIKGLREEYYEQQRIHPLSKRELTARLAMLQPLPGAYDRLDFIDHYFEPTDLEQ